MSADFMENKYFVVLLKKDFSKFTSEHEGTTSLNEDTALSIAYVSPQHPKNKERPKTSLKSYGF